MFQLSNNNVFVCICLFKKTGSRLQQVGVSGTVQQSRPIRRRNVPLRGRMEGRRVRHTLSRLSGSRLQQTRTMRQRILRLQHWLEGTILLRT